MLFTFLSGVYWLKGVGCFKRVNGRKRQVLCDTGGRSWRVQVHAASGHDSRGAQPLLLARHHLRPAWASRLRTVLTDRAVSPSRYVAWAGSTKWPAGPQRWRVASCWSPNAGVVERTPDSHAAWPWVANLTMSL